MSNRINRIQEHRLLNVTEMVLNFSKDFISRPMGLIANPLCGSPLTSLPFRSNAYQYFFFIFISLPISLHVDLRIHLFGFMALIEMDWRGPSYYEMCQLGKTTQCWKIHRKMTKLIRISVTNGARFAVLDFFRAVGRYFDKISCQCDCYIDTRIIFWQGLF